MKLFFLLFILSASIHASSIICFKEFDEIEENEITISKELNDEQCIYDFISGDHNICFKGDVREVALMMDKLEYHWDNLGYIIRDIEVVSKRKNQTIHYTGIDQKNYFRFNSKISRCENDKN